ncbi:putative Capsular polysaccharide type 5 biosynthesis protein cap5A [Oenococcus oeni]|uniref:YveK family protein n=1 Tax=Oenococcus oeni TaxID=1247 RepID=UPI00107D0BD2|nr:Wzz/FepE/Etk N-terminal domain-containing protein [Oenococcus oeni]AVI94875.1 capsular biosynthesis protein [Oenococcus oeni]SYV98662.1 putative Capsular polysaccharide type 5 biosynthesis protein cap5A [Oenococcus oeni]SYW01710.1 putative Capsular polysaccharide type 5 biosynthesis protein cap5A [Oenococcus oeni]SYW19396.1 putative Capsular polysaccharide type 5 biosynthesis protein cap5A [Oenococcus oeni]VDC15498.1 putative Capsular polysaccharide type 5 biosynthesis protein cap5A [Oenoco
MKTYSLLDLLKLIISKWWIWVITAIVFAFVGFGFAKITHFKTYQATSTLTVAHNYSKISQADKQNNEQDAFDLTQSDILLQNSIKSLIKDSAITDNAKKKIDFSSNDINVNSPDNSVLIKISATAGKAKKAVKIANALSKSTKKILPKILPAAGKVIIAQKAVETIESTGPSAKKYALIGAIFGLVLSGVVLLWNDIKDKLR